MLDGYDMLREVLAELGLELTGTTMSYHQREPRGGGPVAASEVDECAAWVAAAAVPGDPDILAAPAGRIHFAGEHTVGQWAGLMEGALRSGQRVASEVPASQRTR